MDEPKDKQPESRIPPVPEWRPNIQQPLERIIDRLACYINQKRDFAVFKNGTCVLLPENGLPEDQAMAQALAALSALFHDHVHFKSSRMDDGNITVHYQHSAINVVLSDIAQANWAEIDRNHLKALAAHESLRTSLGWNVFDDAGKKALFGRCFFFMDVQNPRVVRIVRAAERMGAEPSIRCVIGSEGEKELDKYAAKHPEIGSYRVTIKGTAFRAMSTEWMERHPTIDFLLFPVEILSGDEIRLDLPVLFAAMERFLSHPVIFDDLSEPVKSLESTYRSLLFCSIPDYAGTVDARIRQAANEKDWSRLAELYVLGLHFTVTDPRDTPKMAAFWSSAGHAFLRSTATEKAERFLAQAIKLDPRSVEALSSMASLRFEQKRWPETETLLAQVLELESTNIFALCNQTSIQRITGRVEEARRCLERAKAVDPQSPYVLDLEPLFRRVFVLKPGPTEVMPPSPTGPAGSPAPEEDSES